MSGQGTKSPWRQLHRGRLLIWPRAWSDGDQQALENLVPLVDAELRRPARAYMHRERRDHTLQPTALIHEAFIRLAGAQNIRWQDRAHFFGICARLMRRVLVDYARARGFQKRGARAEKVSLQDVSIPVPELPVDIVALDLALEALAIKDGARVASSSSGFSLG